MKTIHVVAAVIFKDGKIFATQRGYGAFKDGWEFPGGKVEAGETKEEALVRECREELAITLDVGEVFCEVTHVYPDIRVHLTLFNASIAAGIPQKLEHNDIRWITPAEIPQYDFCPADKVILKKIIEEAQV